MLAQGETADSVVSIGGSATSAGDARTVVSVLGDTRADGNVADSAVAVLGDTYIDGTVGRDAVAVLGNVHLGPHADVGRDVVAVGGEVLRDPGAVVHGHVQSIGPGSWGGAAGLRIWIRQCLLYGRPLAWAAGLGWAWGLALGFLALYVGLAALFRDGLTRCARTFETEPGHTVLAALIAMLATPVLVVLLSLTVIGIPVVPFVLMALFLAGLFGKAVMLAVIGRRITGSRPTGALAHPAIAVLAGGVIVTLLYMVPVLGFIVYKLLGILGFGAVAYTLLLAVRERQAAAASAAPAAAAAPHVAADAAAAAAAGAEPAPAATPGPATAAAPATAALPAAGFWVRMAALLLDLILVGIVLGILGHHSHLHLIVLAVYGAVMWKLRGATVGGIICDLRVVRADGLAMDWPTAIVRALGCFLSLAVAGLGFFWIAFDPAHQAWHDKIAGTVVVRARRLSSGSPAGAYSLDAPAPSSIPVMPRAAAMPPPSRRGAPRSPRRSPACCRRRRCSPDARSASPTSVMRSPPTVRCRCWWRCPKPRSRSAVLRTCHGLGVPVVARGAGTGLSGGALPHPLGVTLSLARFNRILKIDPLACTAVVQCGVRNLAISEAAAPHGLYYAPDPSSQIACTIGGNLAENSGGVHCLKYGLTLHNVLRLRGFTADGTAVEFGAEAPDAPGLDLMPLVVGSEGMLAITIEATVRLTPKPLLARCIMASFADLESAGDAVASVIANGIIPAGLELMDQPMVAAAEDYVKAGYDLFGGRHPPLRERRHAR